MNIREKITAWEPGAVWSEAGDGMFTVPVEKFHALAARLRAEGFDFLRSLTGMDWGEGVRGGLPPRSHRDGRERRVADADPQPRSAGCLRSATCGRPRN